MVVVCRADRTGELCWSVGTCVDAGSECAAQCSAVQYFAGRRAGFSCMAREIPRLSKQGTSVKKERAGIEKIQDDNCAFTTYQS